MSLKSSARIKKRRSEAAAATYPVPSAPAQTVSNGSAATAIQLAALSLANRLTTYRYMPIEKF